MHDTSRSQQSPSGDMPDSSMPQNDSREKYLLISSAVKIPMQDIQFEYSHASGPGGQHVNTTDSAVLLRFNIIFCSVLSEDIRRRIISLAGRKINARGELLITASEFRSQKQNKKKALQNLKAMLWQAVRKPQTRKKTVVPTASKTQRLQAKKRKAEKRNQRMTPGMDE